VVVTDPADRTVKARRYAALGIRHYGTVDPEARRLECYRAEGDAYALVLHADGMPPHPTGPV
jgi:hypothetical protein